MDDPPASRGPVDVRGFGVFEFDASAGELRKAGHLVAVRPQALKLLALLLARAGEVVPRADLEHALWDSNTLVDVEQGVNHAIRELRTALGDDAESPRFIQTLPRRGYRFIAPVMLPSGVDRHSARSRRDALHHDANPAADDARSRSIDDGGWLAAAAAVCVLAAAWLVWSQRFGRKRILRALSR